jgi:TRAP-type mannitol/chloroaromatic compound transport system permease small subunit
MKKLLFLLSLLDTINTWVARIASYLVFPMLAVSMYEIIARYIFNSPTLWAGQIISLIFVALMVPGGAYLILKDGHIKMDVFYSRWSPKRKAAIDVATFIILFCFAIMLSWEALKMAWTSLLIKETSWAVFKGPIYPKKITLAVGSVLLLFQGIAHFIRNVLFLRGQEIEKRS